MQELLTIWSRKKKIKNPSCCLKEENFYDRQSMCFSELITYQQTCPQGHVSPSPGLWTVTSLWSVRSWATAVDELWVSEASFVFTAAVHGSH